MKLIDAVLIRLETVMKDKNASLYSLNKEGGIAKSTLSHLLNHKQNKIMLNLLYDILSTMGVVLKSFLMIPFLTM